MSSRRLPLALQQDLLALLRDQMPRREAPAEIDGVLRRLECGGYLHQRLLRGGRLDGLPQGWAAALSRAHRKGSIDNLVALAELRSILPILADERIPFLILKGGAYLVDLYDDPGTRPLTDLDFLVRPADAGRLARRLIREGYLAETQDYEERFRRFEVWRPRPGEVRMEFHWWIGMPGRFRFAQEELWERSSPAALDDLPIRRLAPEDALLYHVAHQADHYFGPSMKWLLDLRQMFHRWDPDAGLLIQRAGWFGARTSLRLALEHLEKVLPGEVPESLSGQMGGAGALRGLGLARHRSRDPLFLFDIPPARRPGRYLLRLLFVDRPADIAGLVLQGLARPVTRRVDRLLGRGRPPWAGDAEPH